MDFDDAPSEISTALPSYENALIATFSSPEPSPSVAIPYVRRSLVPEQFVSTSTLRSAPASAASHRSTWSGRPTLDSNYSSLSTPPTSLASPLSPRELQRLDPESPRWAVPASLLSTDLSINSGGPPISLFCFKSRGTFVDDDIVTRDDKTTIEFYLAKPVHLLPSTTLTLRASGRSGAAVLRISKPNLGSTYRLVFERRDKWESTVKHKSVFSSSWLFGAMDGLRTYRWKLAKGWFQGDWTCTDTTDGQVIATWTRAGFGLDDRIKDNELRINADYWGERALIVGSILVLKDRRAERKTGRS